MEINDIKELYSFWNNARLKRLKDYYDGEHDIKAREMDEGKPNNKLIHNYASYIVDIMQGYFIGSPVVYSSKDEALMEELQTIFDYNDEQDENSEIARLTGIYGKGYEIVYLDENLNIRFNKIDPQAMRVVCNNSINPEIIGAVRRYSETINKATTDYVEVYDKEFVRTYNAAGMVLLDEQRHFFGDVPVIEYINNSDKKSDFEDVVSLIDAYNLSRSNKTNDLEYFTDAYLKLIGMIGTEPDDVTNMRNDRVLLLDENGDAEFLIKPSNVEDAKVQIETLNNDIHKFSKVVDMSDEKFAGNASGVAQQYKLFAMKQVIANKERKFKKGLQRRIELICNYLNFRGANYNYLDVNIKFDRNEPVDVKSKVETANILQGLVSQKTLLSFLPSEIVTDIQNEINMLEEEREAYTDLDEVVVTNETE